MTDKLLSEIDSYLSFLQQDCESFQSGENIHQTVLNSYLTKQEDFEIVISELINDQDDFLYYLYELEIRLRAVCDKLNESNY